MSELQQLKRSSKVSFQEPPLPNQVSSSGLLALAYWYC